MRCSIVALFAMLVLVGVAAQAEEPAGAGAAPLQHYVYFGVERERIAEKSFLEHPGIAGAQLKYTWPELEPERDVYNLDLVRRDLQFLDQHGKRLFIQVQDVSFDESIVNVPAYLLADPAFHGGVARQYLSADDDGAEPVAEGWVARRWDPAVRARFVRLLGALAQAFDGRIEGINLPETSIGFSGRNPEGYTHEAYYESVKALMTEAGKAFARGRVIMYANFMPGEELPEADRGYLRGVYEHADRIGVGVGGPDFLPNRWWQRQHSYPLIAARAEGTVAGLAVQWGNLDDRDRRTGKQIAVQDLVAYARDPLHLNYIFWGTQEPYYSRDVLPFLRALADEGVEPKN